MKLFVFGSTGDLVKRKVLPAMNSLVEQNPKLKIVALGRKEFIDNEYHDFVCEGRCSESLIENMSYKKINFDEDFFEVLDEEGENFEKDSTNYFYISLPPFLLEKTFEQIAILKRNGYEVKILAEKPFGTDLNNANKLLEILNKENLINDVFLSDHYLFKPQIITLDRTLPKDISNIEIRALEKLGLEGREAYYDKTGAIKDMIQSHLLNILFKIIPCKECESLDGVKIKEVVKGQYGDGENSGYAKELGKRSNTETYVKVELEINDKNITLETGKKMNKKETKIKLNEYTEFEIIDSLNPYILMFNEFLKQNRTFFPTIDQTIISWRITEKIENSESKWIYY
jgi:glucose-6-phosphate 1-dehydrogenase